MFYIQRLSLTATLIRKTFPRFTDEEAKPEMGMEAGTPYLNLLTSLLSCLLSWELRKGEGRCPAALVEMFSTLAPQIWGPNHHPRLQDVVGVGAHDA